MHGQLMLEEGLLVVRLVARAWGKDKESLEDAEGLQVWFDGHVYLGLDAGSRGSVCFQYLAK